MLPPASAIIRLLCAIILFPPLLLLCYQLCDFLSKSSLTVSVVIDCQNKCQFVFPFFSYFAKIASTKLQFIMLALIGQPHITALFSQSGICPCRFFGKRCPRFSRKQCFAFSLLSNFEAFGQLWSRATPQQCRGFGCDLSSHTTKNTAVEHDVVQQ